MDYNKHFETTAHEPEQQEVARWLNKVAQRRSPTVVSFLQNACTIANIVGSAQATFVGINCLELGLEVAQILDELDLDQETLAAALLYPSVQHRQLTLQDVEEELSKPVMKLIRGAEQMEAAQSLYHYSTHLTSNTPQVDNLRRMLLAIVEDVRVVIIKLAERLALLRHAKKLNEASRKRLAQESMDIYAALANRLGIGQLKWQLEDLAFRYLEPEAYKELASKIELKRRDRENYVAHIIDILQKALHQADMTEAQITGRVKHIYSIHRKMKRKNVGYEEIYDVTAVRVIVPTITDCYAVLSIVHSLWPHIASEFDDYIATPKPNGYRSIHTAVRLPKGRNLEVQIRTNAMHQESELGIAAHWMYKEARREEKGYDAKIALLREVLEWQRNLTPTEEKAQQVANQVFNDRIYVFTPLGEVIDLPQGATPLDFAYQIHSELGHRCRGAKVNGKIIALNHALHTGECVEILTSKQSSPSRDWLNPQLGYLRSARSRAKVHQWFKQQDFIKHVAEGQAYLDRELRKFNFTSVDYLRLASKLKYQSEKELFAAVANHEIKLTQIINVLTAEKTAVESKPIKDTLNLLQEKQEQQYALRGLDNILSHTAFCCKPIPGDEIVGFITRGRGIAIHRRLCANAQQTIKTFPERFIKVSWQDFEMDGYPVDIIISAHDRYGLIRDITAIFANEKINVIAMQTKSDVQYQKHLFTLTVEVSDAELLEKLLARIKQLPDIETVQRK